MSDTGVPFRYNALRNVFVRIVKIAFELKFRLTTYYGYCYCCNFVRTIIAIINIAIVITVFEVFY